MILLDYKDRRPIYEQVIEKFQQMILCGALQAGESMPSVRSLAMELSLNPNTIQRAYQELERGGYIVSVKGKGSFVSDTQDTAKVKRKALQEEMKGCIERSLAAGFTPQEVRSTVEQYLEAADKRREQKAATTEETGVSAHRTEDTTEETGVSAHRTEDTMEEYGMSVQQMEAQNDRKMPVQGAQNTERQGE